ncbi:MAG: CooT family nickel-binding protein [Desulfobacteraceae bacterium]|jgi:predicted RNA-binding protein
MCEANAYLIKEEQEELLMEAVNTVTPEGDNNWRLVSIFGNQKTVKGRIIGMKLVDHKIYFEAPAD